MRTLSSLSLILVSLAPPAFAQDDFYQRQAEQRRQDDSRMERERESRRIESERLERSRVEDERWNQQVKDDHQRTERQQRERREAVEQEGKRRERELIYQQATRRGRAASDATSSPARISAKTRASAEAKCGHLSMSSMTLDARQSGYFPSPVPRTQAVFWIGGLERGLNGYLGVTVRAKGPGGSNASSVPSISPAKAAAVILYASECPGRPTGSGCTLTFLAPAAQLSFSRLDWAPSGQMVGTLADLVFIQWDAQADRPVGGGACLTAPAVNVQLKW